MKYVVCYSGGHSSAICAINAVRKFGKENVVLLNHDISPNVEDADIKRFKEEVASHLGIEITYANHPDWETKDPISVCEDLDGWKFGNGSILCTYELKTKPFMKWTKDNDPTLDNVYLYGYDNTPDERVRMHKKITNANKIGMLVDFPLITWELEIEDTEAVGIPRPDVYAHYKHANCRGCLKAGWQHWYVTMVHRPDIWERAKRAENERIGFSIHGDYYISDKEDMFHDMVRAGVPVTEHIPPQRFWADAKKAVKRIHAVDVDRMADSDIHACINCMGDIDEKLFNGER